MAEDEFTPEERALLEVDDMHQGSGWYELPSGERVRGKEQATQALVASYEEAPQVDEDSVEEPAPQVEPAPVEQPDDPEPEPEVEPDDGGDEMRFTAAPGKPTHEERGDFTTAPSLRGEGMRAPASGPTDDGAHADMRLSNAGRDDDGYVSPTDGGDDEGFVELGSEADPYRRLPVQSRPRGEGTEPDARLRSPAQYG